MRGYDGTAMPPLWSVRCNIFVVPTGGTAGGDWVVELRRPASRICVAVDQRQHRGTLFAVAVGSCGGSSVSVAVTRMNRQSHVWAGPAGDERAARPL